MHKAIGECERERSMRRLTSKETKAEQHVHMFNCLYVVYYTNILFSIREVAAWNPDIDLYKRYIVYRISFNIPSPCFTVGLEWIAVDEGRISEQLCDC